MWPRRSSTRIFDGTALDTSSVDVCCGDGCGTPGCGTGCGGAPRRPASRGARVRLGEPLPPMLAQHLLTEASRSAWTESRIDQPPGAVRPPLLGPRTSAGAYAPLRSQGRLLGVLAIASGQASSDAPTDEVAQAMSAAIDFAAVSAALITVLLLAAYLPARRATRVDPIVALRAD